MTAAAFDFAAGHDPETQRLIGKTLRRRRLLEVRKVVLGLGFPAALLILWEMLATFGMIDRRFFPAPSRILGAIVTFLSEGDNRALLLVHIGATLRRLVFGFGIGASAGIALGVVMGLNASARFAFSPLLYGLFPLPKIAIYPLMIIIFGLGDASNTALVALGVFFMTCINTLSGVLYANPIYRDVSRAFRMPAATRWFQVIIPSAMPAIITGVRLGLGQALILVVSAEFVSGDTGIGRFIWDSWQVLDIARMFMGLAVVLIFGALAALIGNLLERRLIPWAQH